MLEVLVTLADGAEIYVGNERANGNRSSYANISRFKSNVPQLAGCQ